MRLDEAREKSHLRHGVVVVDSRPVELAHQADRVGQDRVDRARKQEQEGIDEGTREIGLERVTPVPVEMRRLAHDHYPARVGRDSELRAQALLARRDGARSGAHGGAPVSECGGWSVAGQERDQRQDAEREEQTPDHAGRGRDIWPTLRVACAWRQGICGRRIREAVHTRAPSLDSGSRASLTAAAAAASVASRAPSNPPAAGTRRRATGSRASSSSGCSGSSTSSRSCVSPSRCCRCSDREACSRPALPPPRRLAGGSRGAAFLQVPSLFWLDASRPGAPGAALIGVVLSIAVLLGFANGLLMAVLWALYMSFVHVGQLWYGYGWEIQLLETGFLAIFLCPPLDPRPFPRSPPPRAIIWLLRWLIFRIMLGAGLIKLRGDPCWRRSHVPLLPLRDAADPQPALPGAAFPAARCSRPACSSITWRSWWRPGSSSGRAARGSPPAC